MVLTLNCVFILMSVTRKYFRSHFLSLFERQNMKHCVQNLWKEYVILNTVSVKSILLFLNSVFQM